MLFSPKRFSFAFLVKNILQSVLILMNEIVASPIKVKRLQWECIILETIFIHFIRVQYYTKWSRTYRRSCNIPNMGYTLSVRMYCPQNDFR